MAHNARMLDAQVRADLEAGKYRFVDAGCGSGGSLDHCERRFNRRPGLGLDWYGADLDIAREHGFAVAHCDLKTIVLPHRSVDFVSMMDFLEHLPDVAATHRALEAFGRAARDFLFIRHPSFEDIDYLAPLGLKLAWTDWEAHPNMMRIEDYHRLFAALGWTDYIIIPDLPIRDSSHGAILPIDAPRDTEAYDEALHGPKRAITFDRVLHGKFDIFVRLNPSLPDEEWRAIATIQGWRSLWQSPGARKIRHDLHDRETRSSRFPPATQTDVHALTDALLWRAVAHAEAPTPATRDALAELVKACVMARPDGLLHFVHLLDAFNHATGARSVLAVGADAARTAAFLAARCPSIQVDLAPDPARGGYDFVAAIPSRSAALNWDTLLAAVKPGGWLYVAVSHHQDATRDVLDSAVCQLPYDSFLTANIGGALIAAGLDGLVAAIGEPASPEALADLVRLALLDLAPARGDSMAGPIGARYLIRRQRIGTEAA